MDMTNGDRLTSQPQSVLKLLNCGFASGVLQAAIFNPWDRALYLAVKHKRSFLRWSNFVDPFSGLAQTVLQRSVSSGLYFPLEDIFSELIASVSDMNTSARYFLAGMFAGTVNGFMLNPLSVVKYHTWGSSDSKMIDAARKIYGQGGFSVFYKGAAATICRDITFCSVYAVARHIHPSNSNTETFMVNLVAASGATLLSSPFNYVRNIHFATPADQKHKSFLRIFTELYHDTLTHPSFTKRLLFLQERLTIGWGTARVGCGMACAAHIYSLCSYHFHSFR